MSLRISLCFSYMPTLLAWFLLPALAEVPATPPYQDENGLMALILDDDKKKRICMRAKSRLAALAVAVAGIVGTAHASVTSALSGPTDIWAGSTASFTTTITDGGAPSGYDWESISSISYNFLSGDGQSSGGYRGGLGGSSVTVGASFVYATPGDYTPSFSASVVTRDGYQYWVETSYWTDYHHQVSYSYRCGFLGWSTCWSSYWVGAWVYQGYTAYDTAYLQWGTSDSVALTVHEIPVRETAPTDVPEPLTVALTGLGLAALGFSRTRKR